MVHGPLIQTYPGVRLRKPSAIVHQLFELRKSIHIEHALQLVEQLPGEVPEGYAGYVAVPRLDHGGVSRTPEAARSWRKATGWEIRAAIASLEESENFRPEYFKVVPKTLAAFEALEALQGVPDEDKVEQNPVRIFLVRATDDLDPQLEEGEFFLDLGTMMWVLATHSKWIEQEPLLFRCLGERSLHGILKDRTILVGYLNHHRAMNFSHEPSITLIGRIPDIP